MLKLPIRERIFLCISLLLFVFGLTELGILADLNRIDHSVPDETKSNSGVAITVAGVLAIATGLLCMLYAGILTQEKWIKPKLSDPQNKNLRRFTTIVALSSYLSAAAILIIFVFVFIDEQGWILGYEVPELTICADALPNCGEIKAQRWLLIPMWILALALAGLATVNAMIRSRDRNRVANAKEALEDMESQDSSEKNSTT